MPKCYNCREEKPDDGHFMCQKCRDSGIPLPIPRTAKLSDGPGSGNNQIHFMRPDPYKETKRALARAEAAGQLKDPAAMKAAQDKLKALKAQSEIRQKVDYADGGHPLEGLRT